MVNSTSLVLLAIVLAAAVGISSANAECKDWYLYCQSLCGTKANKWCAAGSPYSCIARYGECKQSNMWRDSHGNTILASKKAPRPSSSK
jgi:hypothetical protein